MDLIGTFAEPIDRVRAAAGRAAVVNVSLKTLSLRAGLDGDMVYRWLRRGAAGTFNPQLGKFARAMLALERELAAEEARLFIALAPRYLSQRAADAAIALAGEDLRKAAGGTAAGDPIKPAAVCEAAE